MGSVTLLLALAATAVQAADTIVEVRTGDRIVIEMLTGELSISTWNQDAVEVRSNDGPLSVSVRRRGATVRVAGGEGRRRDRSADVTMRIPAWVDVEVGSRSMDVSASGIEGSLTIGNVNGDVLVENVSGAVDVRSVSGAVEIIDATGGVRASSQSDDVTLRRVSGPVEAHSGNGDIVLDDVRSVSVRAESRDGDIDFSGTVTDDGDYGFFLHDGDATIAMPAVTSAQVSVSTFDGEFQSEFAVRVDRFTSGRQFDFVLGDGGARVQIDVFDGDISLLQIR